MLPLKPPFPPYTAVMECFATASDDVVNEAWPLLRGTLPSNDEPSKNWTIPVADDGETVAVKVTACPLFEGLSLDVNVVVVLALFTACESVEDVLLA